MGGTVRFVSKQPDLEHFTSEFGTDLSHTEHGGINFGENGVINIPLIEDKLAVRASVGYLYDSGYIDNYSLTGQLQDSGTNNERALVVRVTAKYVPTPDWTVTATYFWQQDRTGDTSVFYTSMPLWTQDKEVREPGRDELRVPSLTVEGNLGFADLTSGPAISNDRLTDGRMAPITTILFSPSTSSIRSIPPTRRRMTP